MRKKLRLVVTGGAGMVGSYIAERFAAGKHEVTAIDNLSRLRYLGYKTHRRYLAWDALRRYKGVTRVVGDIRRVNDLKRVFRRGADLVVHAAGQVGVQTSLKHPHLDFELNALGTLRLLEAVRRWAPNATVIFCSTNKVYGDSINAIPVRVGAVRYFWRGKRGISENWPIDQTGHTPYGVSKLTGDLYMQEYAHSYGLRTAVLRMSCIYGERQLGMPDQGWVAWLALAVLKGWPITVYGTGKQVRDLLYVQDLARLCEAYYRSSCGSEVFNVGGGPQQTASVLEVLRHLERLFGKHPTVRFAKERPHDQRVYISDIRRVQRLVKWSPRVNVQEGLRRLTRWLKQNASLFDG